MFNKINWSLKVYNYLNYHHFCCLSLLNFVYPLYFFYKKAIKNNYEKNCAGLTVLMILFGELFWINPIRLGLFHKIDSFVVKVSFLYHLNYLFFRKSLNVENKTKLYKSFWTLLISLYFSNYFSSKQWCSKYHILFHIITHISSSYGISFAYK
jgi:hypothetical protein